MSLTTAFESEHQRYDLWFERHTAAYHSELLAVRALLPWRGRGLAIGVGTGRFAAPLGVQIGLDPVSAMLDYAMKRGITAVQGTAEALPFRNGSFHYILSITTICFVDNVIAMLSEAKRVLKPGGIIVLGFINRETKFGQRYLIHQADNVFYREATFYSAAEVERLLSKTGFIEPCWVQTLFSSLEETRQVEPLRTGYGQGAFVVVRASLAE
jgi:ubiquinone/menaquinone biosynthesis C-methylase UbiE